MLEITQFKNKIKTHGMLRTLYYSAQFASRPLWRRIWLEPVRKSYSQRYEDIIIDKILGNKSEGTYLDVGAFDPHVLSNTKRFYARGWRGCNVEPSPRRFERFVQLRPEDINLNVGLSDSAGRMTFYDVAPDAFSTFSEERAKELKEQGARIKAEIEVPVITMRDLFAEYLNEAPVDFCSIDTEGTDLTILKGNDWSRFRPRVICVEVSNVQSYEASRESAESVEAMLATVGYKKHTQTIDFGVPLNEIYVSAT